MKRSFILGTIVCMFSCLYSIHTYATHINTGYITYTRDQGENPNPRKILYELILFTNDDSQVEDPKVIISMGDGKFIAVQRQGPEIPIGNQISKAIYKWEYTYGADGTYTVSWVGRSRNNNILNIAQPSQDLAAYISTTININSLGGPNSSPNFLAPMPIFAKTGKRLEYNLLAYDADGDSIGYRLITPLTTTGGPATPVPGYTLPHQTFDCSNEAETDKSTFTLNNVTGQFIWDAPCRVGTYNIAIVIEDWKITSRNGQRLAVKQGEIIYDMLITTFDHPDDGLTILNKDELNTSVDGYIAAKPGEELTLKIAYNELIPARTPIPENNQEPFSMFASELSMLLNADINYTIDNTANGAVGTFRFTPTKEMARARPYFISVYGGAENSLNITRSIGILVGNLKPNLVLLNPKRYPQTVEGYYEIGRDRVAELAAYVEYPSGYTLDLAVSSALSESAKNFSYLTRDTANSKIGELLLELHDYQLNESPQKITFTLTALPTATGSNSEPVVDVLSVYVVAKSTLKLDGELVEGEISVLPNPVSELLLVESGSEAKLFIYTTNGSLVWENHLTAGSNRLIRPANLSPGLYFYTILNTKGHKKTGKLMLK